MNSGATFNTLHTLSSVPTQLDHIYSNQPTKCLSVITRNSTSSDHSMIIYVRSSKPLNSTQNYYITRDYKKFNKMEF